MHPSGSILTALAAACAVLATAATASATATPAPSPTPAFTQVAGSPFAAGQGATAVAFSPNGQLLAVADYSINAVSMYTVTGRGRLDRVPGSPFPVGTGPVSLAFAPDGHSLAVADFGANALSVDAIDGHGRLTPRGTAFGVAGPPYDVTYSPDGQRLAVADSTGDAIQVFGLAHSVPVGPGTSVALPAASDPTSVSFSPDGSLLAVAEHGSDAIGAYSVAPGRAITLAPLAGSPFSTGASADTVSFNREGTLVATSDYSADRIDLLDVSSAAGISAASTPTIATSPGSGPDDVLFSPVSDTLALALGTANRTDLFSVTAGAAPGELPGAPLPAGTGPTGLAFNPQGTLLASANIYSSDVSVYASTAPPPAVTQILSRRATIRGARVTLKVGCAGTVDGGGGHPCRGRLSLARDGRRLGSTALSLAPGRARSLSVSLPASVIRQTRNGRAITVTAELTARGASPVTRAITIRR